MNKEGKTGHGGWQIARDRAKAKYARKMALGKHWRQRWDKEPEFMRANLNRLIARNRQEADRKTEKLNTLLARLPAQMKSWEFRQTIAETLRASGMPGDRKQVHRVVMALIRRGMAVYDEQTVSWTVMRHVK